MPLPVSPSDVTRFRRLDAPTGVVVSATKRPTASTVPVTPVASRIATAVIRASNVTTQIAPRTSVLTRSIVNSGRGKK